MENGLKTVMEQYLTSLGKSGVSSIPTPKNDQISDSCQSKPASGATEALATSGPGKTTSVRETGSPENLLTQTELQTTSLTESGNMTAKKRPSKNANAEQLAILEREVSGCVKCPHLAESRTQTVFGIGNPNPRLCFVGEAPGADEDKQGVPFIGRAGQLLEKILEACNMKRDDTYILNTIKCRPPSNRNPSEEELENCWGYALSQLEILKPEFICCLGGVAAQTVLKTKTPIGKLRGQFHEFDGIKVMVTYHPAYLLRNPNAKKLVWEDMKRLMSEMGTPVE